MKSKLQFIKVCSLVALLIPPVAMTAHANGSNLTLKNTIKPQGPVTGVVKDATGQPLPGVTVSVKGTTRGTQTDANGKYTVDANPGDVLVFSFIGFASKEVIVGNVSNIAVVLADDTKKLNEVVVTALGITRQSKTLTYGVQTFRNSDLNAVKDPSVVNTLSGKVAGAQITKSSSGVGGSTKVVLRGNKSINGENNALFVIDGVPMPRNISSQITSAFGGQDRGDAIENLNSEDIESITVLPGSAASALYGSAGSNGVVVITTKKGTAGNTTISFSSNTTFENAFKLPDFQNQYGQSSAGANDSWATTKLSTPSTFDPKSFYNTGNTFTNSLSVQTGTETNQTYFSFESTNAKGIIPENKLDKYNFTVRNSSQFLNKKLTLDLSVNYINQQVQNRPNQGFYYNPIVPLYIFPRGVDFNQYKNNYEVYDPTRNLKLQNWPYAVSDIATQNPYWIVNRNTNQDRLSRIIGAMTTKYTFNDWFNIQARLNVDRTNGTYEAENYASSTTTLVGPKGAYTYNPNGVTQTYADFLANFNKKFNDFTVNVVLGASLQNTLSSGSNISGNLLNFANLFSISNIDYGRVFPTQYADRLQKQSLFGTASIGYKDKIFLDLTSRNDWDSSLSYTSKDNYFYPSVGLNAVLTQLFKMPEFISFAKIRGNITGVGNGSQILYASNPTNAVSNGSTAGLGAKQFDSLKPERTKTYELGTDWRFLNDRLSFTFNIYRSFTTDQIYSIKPSSSTTVDNFYVNGGNVRNQGIETTISYDLKAGDFSWRPSVNFSLNRNKILTVVDYIDPFTTAAVDLQYQTLSTDYVSLRAQKGGSFGDFYSQTLEKDASGKYITDPATGLPIRSNDFSKVGNYNPQFLAGFQNQFSYKHFSLGFLIDGHFGGQVVSMTNAVLDQFGTSAATAAARNNGGVDINGKKVDSKAYYDLIDGRNGIAAQYVYSATNIRLRELTFGYILPGSMFNNKIKNIGLTVVARNLFFIKNNAPFDPDATLSTQNGLQGLDIFNTPTIRSVGFKLSAQF